MEGEGRILGTWEMKTKEQVGLDTDNRALTGTQVPKGHKGHTGAEAAANLSPGQVRLDQDPTLMNQDSHFATLQKSSSQGAPDPLPKIPFESPLAWYLKP